MSRPSPFEIMRRNRHRRRDVAALIDAAEDEMQREWAAERARIDAERRAHFIDTGDWLRDTRDETRRAQPPRRRWWQIWSRA